MEDNALRRQVFSLPELIREQYEDLEPKTRKVLSTPEIFGIQKIVLTGCGDSLAASMAVKPVMEALVRVPVEIVSSIDLGRLYPDKQLGSTANNPLVIAVSNSGGVARISEAVQRANKYGAFTLGITGNMESPLGQQAQRVLKLDIPDFESAPGTRTYMVSVLALLLLAIRFGEVRGCYTMDEAMAYRVDLLDQGRELQKLLPQMDEQVRNLAKTWAGLAAYDFVGAGSDFAAAWYGHAKIFEAAGKFAMYANSEDWLHLNFFIRDSEQLGTVVVAHTANPAHSRTREMLAYAAQLDRPLAVITDGTEADFGTVAAYIQVPRTAYAQSMTLTQYAPLALLAGYIAQAIGEEDGRGCKGKWAFSAGGAGVRHSEMIIM